MNPLAHHSDPETSHQAAFNFDPEPLTVRICMALTIFQWGATTHEIAGYLDEPLVSVSPRMRPLVRQGKVRDSGRRDTKARTPRIIWELIKHS